MRIITLVALLVLSSCNDARCGRDKFYCLKSEEQQSAIKAVNDQKLLELAEIDRELSRPPSDSPIYELRERGQERARRGYYHYGSRKPLTSTLDAMTRIFSDEWPVCSAWKSEAPNPAKRAIMESCFRVFEEPIDLNKSVDR